MGSQEKIILPNSVLLAMAVEAVGQGRSVIIPVKGQSMEPFISGRGDCVELFPPADLAKGDVVLARFESGQYIMHRIISLEKGGRVTLMGDGNTSVREHCTGTDIKAKALVVIRSDGKRCRLDSRRMRTAAFLWRLLLPFRGILLRIWRRLA